MQVPIANRVGAEGDGWTVAKQLMRFARSNNTTSGLLRRAFRAVERLMSLDGSIPDELLERRNDVEIAIRSFESFELRLLSGGRLSGDDEVASSLMKSMASELHQRITELGIEAAGPYGAVDGYLNGNASPLADEAAYASRKYFSTRAASIYSGTNETHRNIIARSLIDLRR